MTSSNTQSPLDAIANVALGLDAADAAASTEAAAQAADATDGSAFAALGLSPEIVSVRVGEEIRQAGTEEGAHPTVGSAHGPCRFIL